MKRLLLPALLLVALTALIETIHQARIEQAKRDELRSILTPPFVGDTNPWLPRAF